MNSSVTIFLPSLDIGGAEKSMSNLAHGFAERGMDTSLVLAGVKGALRDRVTNGVRTIELKSGRVLWSLIPLSRYLREQRPDILLSAMDHANLVALAARKLANVDTKVIVTTHKMPSQARDPDTVGKRELLLPLLMGRIYPWADSVVVVSTAAAADVAARTGLSVRDIKVIPNPVVDDELHRLANESIPQPWSSLQIPLILGVGRLSPEKDFATLIRAFWRVSETRPCRLLILGNGPENNALTALISQLGLDSKSDLPGAVDNPIKFMARASVFVLPSRWESFGIALVEAMACGTPVVATRSRGGVEEILEGSRYGQMVPVGDDEAMAEAIIETLDNPPRAELLRSRANEYSVERVVDQYIQLF